jgi:type I restriction enzyme S subunit
MQTDWKTEKISTVANVTDFVANGSFESLRNNVTYRTTPDYAILVRLVDHNAGWKGDFVYVNKASFDFLKKSFVVPGDIIIANVGANAGTVFRAPKLSKPMTLGPNAILCRPRDKTILNDDFFYYFLTSKNGQDAIASIRGGSAQPKFNKTDFRSLSIPFPSLNEQASIAHKLKVLDDKIELNRRMNETLEALVQSLFKSWFVDATQSALPKGWRVSTIGEEVRVVGGSTPSTTKPEFWEGGTHHWATPKDLSDLNSPVLLKTGRKITNAGIQQISSGLLPVGTVLLSSRAPIGYLVIAEVPVAINQGFIAMICDGSLPNHYVRLWTKTNMDAIEGRANGTTFMEISKGNFRSLPVIVPPKPMLDDFQNQVESLHRRVVSNLQESRTLAALRDALLPKLLSGELRVPAATKLMEACA